MNFSFLSYSNLPTEVLDCPLKGSKAEQVKKEEDDDDVSDSCSGNQPALWSSSKRTYGAKPAAAWPTNR